MLDKMPDARSATGGTGTAARRMIAEPRGGLDRLRAADGRGHPEGAARSPASCSTTTASSRGRSAPNGEVKNAIPGLSWSDSASAAALAVSGLCAQMQHAASDPGQARRPRYGKPISDADIAPWNIDIRTSDGRGLPAGTRHRGRRARRSTTRSASRATARTRRAARSTARWSAASARSPRTPGSLTPGSMYPYAPILFDYIRRTMPMDRPQTPDDRTRCTRCRRTS